MSYNHPPQTPFSTGKTLYGSQETQITKSINKLLTPTREDRIKARNEHPNKVLYPPQIAHLATSFVDKLYEYPESVKDNLLEIETMCNNIELQQNTVKNKEFGGVLDFYDSLPQVNSEKMNKRGCNLINGGQKFYISKNLSNLSRSQLEQLLVYQGNNPDIKLLQDEYNVQSESVKSIIVDHTKGGDSVQGAPGIWYYKCQSIHYDDLHHTLPTNNSTRHPLRQLIIDSRLIDRSILTEQEILLLLIVFKGRGMRGYQDADHKFTGVGSYLLVSIIDEDGVVYDLSCNAEGKLRLDVSHKPQECARPIMVIKSTDQGVD